MCSMAGRDAIEGGAEGSRVCDCGLIGCVWQAPRERGRREGKDGRKPLQKRLCESAYACMHARHM